MKMPTPVEKLVVLEREQDALIAKMEKGELAKGERFRMDLLEEEISAAQAEARSAHRAAMRQKAA